MMAEWRHRQLRGRSAMDIRHRPQRRLSRRPAVKFPREFLAERQRIEQRQLRKHIVRMLVIDQRLVVIRLARLKKLRKSRMRRSQRLGGKHLPEQNRPRTQRMLLHQHRPVHRLRLALAAKLVHKGSHFFDRDRVEAATAPARAAPGRTALRVRGPTVRAIPAR